MERIINLEKIRGFLERYKYVMLIVAVGIFFMMLPDNSNDEAEPAVQSQEETYDLNEELCQILSQIRGVGKVKVLLTEREGQKITYQVDEDRTTSDDSESVRQDTVTVSGSGTESALIQSVAAPTYLGAIIVCQGGGSPAVRLAVANAVAAVTGISTDRISVLEMK